MLFHVLETAHQSRICLTAYISSINYTTESISKTGLFYKFVIIRIQNNNQHKNN